MLCLALSMVIVSVIRCGLSLYVIVTVQSGAWSGIKSLCSIWLRGSRLAHSARRSVPKSMGHYFSVFFCGEREKTR